MLHQVQVCELDRAVLIVQRSCLKPGPRNDRKSALTAKSRFALDRDLCEPRDQEPPEPSFGASLSTTRMRNLFNCRSLSLARSAWRRANVEASSAAASMRRRVSSLQTSSYSPWLRGRSIKPASSSVRRCLLAVPDRRPRIDRRPACVSGSSMSASIIARRSRWPNAARIVSSDAVITLDLEIFQSGRIARRPPKGD
jgi:hypothetical protein